MKIISPFLKLSEEIQKVSGRIFLGGGGIGVIICKAACLIKIVEFNELSRPISHIFWVCFGN